MTSSKGSSRRELPVVPEGVPAPKCRVDQVLERRQDVVDTLCHHCERRSGQPPLDLALVRDVAYRVAAILGVDGAVVAVGLSGLVGHRPSRAELSRIGWRLAGNLDILQAFGTVRPVATVETAGWFPFQIVRVQRRAGKTRVEYVARLRYLAGTVAAEAVDCRWSSSAVRVLAYELGFAKGDRERGSRRTIVAPEQLVLLRAYGYLPAQAAEFVPVEIRAFDQEGWNREVLGHRYRDKGWNCPAGYPPSHPCHRCPVGYRRCIAATHLDDYVLGDCSKCHGVGVAFDPADLLVCVDCRRNEARFP